MNLKEVAQIILFLIVLYVIYRLMQGLGLADSKIDQQAAAALNLDIFNNPNKYINDLTKGHAATERWNMAGYTGDMVKSYQSMQKLSKDVFDAQSTIGSTVLTFGYLHDQPDTIFGIFQSFKNKLAVAIFANVFKATTGRGLIDYLNKFLSTSEMSRLYDIVNSKPNI